MPLTKNKLSVPFSEGLETKTDDQQSQLSGLRRLENVIFETPQKLRKRNGYSSVTTKLLDDTEIENARHLTKFIDELGMMTDTDYYAYSESLDRWTNKGKVFTATPTSETVVRNNREQKNIDLKTIENLSVYVYEDNSGVRYSIKDIENDSFLVNNALVSASGIRPKVSSIQNVVFIFYAVGNCVKYKYLNLIKPTELSAEGEFTCKIDPTAPKYDVVEEVNKIYLAFNTTAQGSTSGLTNNITLFSEGIGASRTGDTISFEVEADAANPTDTVLVDVTGTVDAVTITITPNDGTNNPGNVNADATLDLTTDIELTNVQTGGVPETVGSSRNGTTLTTNVNAPAANPTDTVLVDFTGTASAIDVDITPNDGTNNPANSNATCTIDNQLYSDPGDFIFTDAAGGTGRNGDTITLNITDNPALAADEVILTFGGTASAVTIDLEVKGTTQFDTLCSRNDFKEIVNTGAIPGGSGLTTLTLNDPSSLRTLQTLSYPGGTNLSTILETQLFPNPGVQSFSGGTIIPVDLTTAELVELINTGSVAGKNVTVTDASSLRALQTATGGDATVLADSGEGDGTVATFANGVTNSVTLTTAEVTELINTGAVAGKNVTLTDASSLLDDLGATGGGAEDISDGGELDGELVLLQGGVTLQTINESETISSEVTLGGEEGDGAIDLIADAQERIILSFANSTEVKSVVFTNNLGTQIVPLSVIETISDVKNVTSIQDTDDVYKLYYEISATDSNDHYIKQNTIDLLATVGTPSVFKRSVGLAAKATQLGDEVYVLTLHESTLQSTYFLLDENGQIMCKISPNIGGEHITENSLPKITIKDSSTIIVPSQIKGRAVVDDDEFFSLLGVNGTEISFTQSNPFENERLGENLHIAGGVLKMYDGAAIVEHGFHVFPEGLSDAGTATTGGSMSDGAYQYAAVYAWTDNKGQLHRSAPSIGFSVTLSGGTSTQTQDIEVPTLRLTQKDNVAIELYRTEAAGTIFYKVSDTQSPTLNDPTIDSVTIQDTLSDSDLLNNEVLYTTGGVLDNIAAPSSKIIESFSDRIFLAGLEDENRLQYSKIRFDGEPVEFNDALTIPVNSKGGEITALAAMDEKLIIFKESAMFYLSGDGPNNIGQQDTFIKPELISSDIGCINSSSVVLTPLGLMFKSKKGIYLLSRSAELRYIGAAVEDFNDLQITSADVIAEKNQVRFTASDGDTIVYNYFSNKWATFSNHRALSAVNVDSDYYYLRFDGVLYLEDENTFTDVGSPVNIELETNWISFAGVQGFQRVYKLLILGEFKSPHKLRVRIAYDFNDAFVQEVIIDTADFNDNTRFGEDSPYGEPTTKAFGGDGNLHQMRIDLKRQKCQAIKVRIEEIQDDPENLGEGLTLSNVMFEIGQKTGTNKLDNVRKYGTE